MKSEATVRLVGFPREAPTPDDDGGIRGEGRNLGCR